MSNRIFAAVGAAIIAIGGVVGLVAVGSDSPQPTFADLAAGAPDVCPPGDSGKIDTPSGPLTVRITAPEGNVITAYCVKAGSVQSGAGTHFVFPTPPRRSILISHPSGKDISHYSFEWKPCDCTTTTVPETTVPETTVPETTVPETTVPETTVPETTVPETTVPETTVPETTVPETTVPETTVPETTVPPTTVVINTVPTTTAPPRVTLPPTQ